MHSTYGTEIFWQILSLKALTFIADDFIACGADESNRVYFISTKLFSSASKANHFIGLSKKLRQVC